MYKQIMQIVNFLFVFSEGFHLWIVGLDETN